MDCNFRHTHHSTHAIPTPGTHHTFECLSQNDTGNKKVRIKPNKTTHQNETMEERERKHLNWEEKRETNEQLQVNDTSSYLARSEE